MAQGSFVSATERIGKGPKALIIQKEAVMLNLPEIFALALIKDKR